VAKSSETQTSLAEAAEAKEARGGAGEAAPGASRGKTPHLDQYTVNLTANAKAGKIDPVLGRDQEVRQMIDILMRRRQNNPILTGEAGVGKTAVVEGFANRVVSGDVPPALQGVHIHSLDLALLQAGAGVKGEFENRLKGLINEVKSSTEKIILFIDEAHTMIGAGGQAGQGRRGQSAEAGAGTRGTAHHRRDHLVGVQEVLREGPGAGQKVPGGQG
jgi:type VI secretion system protein VasG